MKILLLIILLSLVFHEVDDKHNHIDLKHKAIKKEENYKYTY